MKIWINVHIHFENKSNIYVRYLDGQMYPVCWWESKDCRLYLRFTSKIIVQCFEIVCSTTHPEEAILHFLLYNSGFGYPTHQTRPWALHLRRSDPPTSETTGPAVSGAPHLWRRIPQTVRNSSWCDQTPDPSHQSHRTSSAPTVGKSPAQLIQFHLPQLRFYENGGSHGRADAAAIQAQAVSNRSLLRGAETV